MLKRVLLFIFMLLPGMLLGETPILVIDSGGHMAKIKDIMFTSDGRYLVSAAYDKTVRVWDAETGEMVRTIRGQIKEGDEGKLYAAALSPDDRWLAVGGWMKYDEIRLIDFRTGEIVALLKGHSNVLLGLDFSPDSRRLVSSSSDKTAIIWDVLNQKKLHVLEGHEMRIYGVAYSADNSMVATGSDDDSIKLWDAYSGRLITTMTGHTKDVLSLVFTPDGRYLLSGSDDKTIRLWRAESGRLVKVLATQNTTVDHLSVSPNSRMVLSGSGIGGKKTNNIYTIPDGYNQTAFKKHRNIVLSTAFGPYNKVVATGGGSNQEIYIWDVRDGAVKHKMVGKGKRVWNVGFAKDGRSIAWGKTWRSGNLFDRGDLEQRFNLIEDGEFKPSLGSKMDGDPHGEYTRGIRQVGSLSIRTPDGGVNKELEILRNGSVAHTVVCETSTCISHRGLTLSPDGQHVISGGSNGSLLSFDPYTGKQLHEFVGHAGDVWGVAVSPDSRYLVSGSDDQTVRLWDLGSGKNLLTVFHASDNQWVAWTPEGYYSSSSGGDKYIGWQINQGYERSALYYPASRFADQFRQPLVVGNYVKTRGDLDRAIKLANDSRGGYKKNVKKYGAGDLQNILPPAVFIQFPTETMVTTADEKFCVKAVARSLNNEDITDIWLTLNGRKTRGLGVSASAASQPEVNKQLLGRRASLEQCVQLTDRDNTISVFASNQYGSSDPEVISVRWKGNVQQIDDIFKPKLYVLSIGISRYADSQLNLDVAHKDAKAVARIFQGQEGKLFRKVESRVLLDDQATRDDILDGLDWILQESTQKDMSIIFMAGHGMNDKRNNYYFLPHDAEMNRLRRTGVKWFDFQDVVVSLPSKTILMVDTCHSGNVTGKRRGLSDMTEAIRELNSADSGVVVMTAATGREVSQERPEWGHGAFTKALVEGLGSLDADYNRNGIVEIKELDLFITERVKALTGGSQHPTTEIPQTLPNFPVAAR